MRLLTSKEVATFVARGYLRWDGVVPDAVNEAALSELEAGVGRRAMPAEISAVYAAGSGLRAVLDLPEIAGALHSLLGPRAVVHNHDVHLREPEEKKSQPLHADQIADVRDARRPYESFDVTLMYYPQAVSADMGGTLLVPGSHLRRVHGADVGRYQNLRGQVKVVCPGGTVLVLHHGIWHCGRQNRSGRRRYMFRARLHPTGCQRRWWDTSDLDDPGIRSILLERFDWYEMASARVEFANRMRMWRSLSARDGQS